MKKTLSICIVFLLICMLVACSGTARNSEEVRNDEKSSSLITQEENSLVNEVEIETADPLSYEYFLSLLTENGLSYEIADKEIVLDNNVFSVPKKQLIVLGENLVLLEYDSNEKMEFDAAGISKSGDTISIPGNSIGFLDDYTTPNFFKKDSIIVYYVGKNEKIVSFLVDIFGEQFAGGKTIIGESFDYSTFIYVLKENGFTYEDVDTSQNVENPPKLFAFDVKRILVGEDVLQIVEYDSKESMERDAAMIRPDGSNLPYALVDWVSYPHFFKKDKLIVYYVGTNETMIAFLTEVFGEQFAGM